MKKLCKLVREFFDLRPYGLTQAIGFVAPDLSPNRVLRPLRSRAGGNCYNGKQHTAFTWEKTDKADALRDAAGLK
jgi:S-adenosylmethionine synthetase